MMTARPGELPVQDEIVELSSRGPLEIIDAYANKLSVARWEKFELTLQVRGEWDNPFDPEQIVVDAVLAAPSGRTVTAPGFFYQEYHRAVKEGAEIYNTVGAPCWKVRFAPDEVGEYSYFLRATNAGREVTSETRRFRSTAQTNSHGPVRVSEEFPLYLEHVDSTPFYAVGVCQHISDLILPESFYPDFARAGGNLNRIFAVRIGERMHWPWDPEPFAPRPDRGFGKMCLRHSWMLDRLIELGERLGITHALSLANPTDMQGENWPTCCYNVTNGGPLTDIRDYASNEAARVNFRRELRYFVARWAYSTSVFSWNLWNEVNWMPDFTPEKYVGWHREMAAYLKQIDWAGHIIHTNYGKINDVPALDGLPEMQIVSTNTYGMKDFAPVAETWTRHLMETYHKPALFGEYGIGHQMGPDGYAPHDRDRVMIHNGNWAALMCGAAGTGLALGWHWLQDKAFYRYTSALRTFIEGVPLTRRDWRPLEVESFRFADKAEPSQYRDVFAEGWPHNFEHPAGDSEPALHISADGGVSGQEHCRAYLSGSRVLNLDACYPVDGRFAVFVPELRPDQEEARLTVSVDGQVALDEPLPPREASDPRAFYRCYESPVNAGTHRISVRNGGGGTFATAFELRHFILREGPDLQVRGIQAEDTILIWLKHQKYTWLHARTGVEPDEQSAGVLTLADVRDGAWVAEWMDTVDSKWIGRSVTMVKDGTLALRTPPVKRSVAVRLRLCDGNMGDGRREK